MSRVYISLLAVAAFLISGIGATFSIFGLTSLFAGAVVSVGIMAASLEFAKLVTAGFLYRYWGHIGFVMRNYLSVAVIILSIITSMGIFGFLSNAYQQSSMEYRKHKIEMDGLLAKEKLIKDEVLKIEKFINEIPSNRITKKFSMYEESRYRVQDLNSDNVDIQKQIHDLQMKMLHVQTDIGPMLYVADLVGADVDSVAKFLILVFVSVFDPLAICLVFALSLAIRLKEKYRGKESRISEHAFSTPVDHRKRKFSLKKSA
jgi:hypothetical protein